MAKQIKDEQVYESVLETLIENGYSGSTTKKIAQKAGMNEVTLFRKYGSKGELVAAAIRYERLKMDDTKIQYTGDLRADLLLIVQSYLKVSVHQSKLFPLIVSEMFRYPELRDAMKVPHEIVQMFAVIISRYQTDGSLKDGEPILLVMNLLGPIIVHTMLNTANPDLQLPPIDIEQHIDRFLTGNIV
ncbi:MAG: TetR/AcrR family transcriptional regulator [Chloroflexota bacterium]